MYFDGTYFDGAYFDTGVAPVAVPGGGAGARGRTSGRTSWRQTPVWAMPVVDQHAVLVARQSAEQAARLASVQHWAKIIDDKRARDRKRRLVLECYEDEAILTLMGCFEQVMT